MPSVDIVDLSNAKVGSIELADAVFGAEVNESLLYRKGGPSGTPPDSDLVQHQAKTRHEVSGSGKKLWKRRALAGPVSNGFHPFAAWRHGGTIHSPQPRSYAGTRPQRCYWAPCAPLFRRSCAMAN